MIENDSMIEGDRRAMMRAMMEQFFSGMGPDEKKEMFVTMMGKMTEDIDMKEMTRNTMTGRSIVRVSHSSSSSS
jgi:hypothetical protein